MTESKRPTNSPIKIIIGVEQVPRIQFTLEIMSGESPPDLIRLPDGSLVAKRGKYLSPGDRWSYQRVADPIDFAGPVNEWPENSGLKG